MVYSDLFKQVTVVTSRLLIRLAELLGHADPGMLLRTYYHVLPEQKKEAVQVLNQFLK